MTKFSPREIKGNWDYGKVLDLHTTTSSVPSNLEIALMVVVLPAPLAPTSATMPPAGTSSYTPFNTKITWS